MQSITLYKLLLSLGTLLVLFINPLSQQCIGHDPYGQQPNQNVELDPNVWFNLYNKLGQLTNSYFGEKSPSFFDNFDSSHVQIITLVWVENPLQRSVTQEIHGASNLAIRLID